MWGASRRLCRVVWIHGPEQSAAILKGSLWRLATAAGLTTVGRQQMRYMRCIIHSGQSCRCIGSRQQCQRTVRLARYIGACRPLDKSDLAASRRFLGAAPRSQNIHQELQCPDYQFACEAQDITGQKCSGPTFAGWSTRGVNSLVELTAIPVGLSMLACCL